MAKKGCLFAAVLCCLVAVGASPTPESMTVDKMADKNKAMCVDSGRPKSAKFRHQQVLKEKCMFNPECCFCQTKHDVAVAKSSTGEVGASWCLHKDDPLAQAKADNIQARRCNCGQPRMISGPKFVSHDASHMDVGFFVGFLIVKPGEQLAVFAANSPATPVATGALKVGAQRGVQRIVFNSPLEPNAVYAVRICNADAVDPAKKCRKDSTRSGKASLEFKSVGCSHEGESNVRCRAAAAAAHLPLSSAMTGQPSLSLWVACLPTLRSWTAPCF